MANYFFQLDASGYEFSCPLPADCIRDCSAQGSVDESVEYWVKRIAFDAPKDGATEYLKAFGAWDDDELADHEANLRRVLWLICWDLKEGRPNG